MKKVNINNKDFGKRLKGVKSNADVSFHNKLNQNLCISANVRSDSAKFVPEICFISSDEDSFAFIDEAGNVFEFPTLCLPARIPVNAIIYSDENGNIKDSDGKYYTEDKGFGIAGTTDENGVYKVNNPADGIVFADEDAFIFQDEEGNLFEALIFVFSDTEEQVFIDENSSILADI